MLRQSQSTSQKTNKEKAADQKGPDARRDRAKRGGVLNGRRTSAATEQRSQLGLFHQPLLAILALAIELQNMRRQFKTKLFSHFLLQLFDMRIGKFTNFATRNTS